MGSYSFEKEVEELAPEIVGEWHKWLDAQRDPGNYESYKVKDPTILPYTNGHPQWVTEVFMPQHLVNRLPESLRNRK